MKVTCHNCRKVLRVPKKLAGKKVRCPGCKQPIKVPGAGEPPSAEDLSVDLTSLGSIVRSVVRHSNCATSVPNGPPC